MERLRSQLPCVGPGFPVGRWGRNPHRTGGQMSGWRGKHMAPGTQQALAQRRSQRGPEPRQHHVGWETGQQGWEP